MDGSSLLCKYPISCCKRFLFEINGVYHLSDLVVSASAASRGGQDFFVVNGHLLTITIAPVLDSDTPNSG